MQYYLRSIIIIFLIPLFSSASYAAAWLQPLNRYSVISNYHWVSSYKLYTNPDITFSKHGFSQDIEYGITQDLTLGINHQVNFGEFKEQYRPRSNHLYCYQGHGDPVSCKYFNNNDYGYEGNFSLYIRKLLRQNQTTILSIQPFISLYKLEAEVRILLGHNFIEHKKKHFLNAELGFRTKQDAPDELIFDFTHGTHLPYNTMLLTQFFIKYHLNKLKYTNKYLREHSYPYKYNSWVWHQPPNNINYTVIKNPYYHPLTIIPKISVVKFFNDNCAVQVGISTDTSFSRNKRSRSKSHTISLSLWVNV